METTAQGLPLRSYIWQNQTPLAQIDLTPTGPRLLYLHTDHLHTPRAASNATGTVVWRWAGEAFGSTTPLEDPDGDALPTIINLRFPGQYFDGETGFFYNWNRYYDPRLGRYITSDPIGLDGGLNAYAYVRNNPLRYIDPLGLAGNSNTATGSLGAGGSIMTGQAGASASSGVVGDTKGTICVYSSLCTRLGIGESGGLGFALGVGLESKPLCSGTTVTVGAFIEGGAGLFGNFSPSVNTDATSVGIGKSIVGVGGGTSIGGESCLITLICFNESESCSNSCNK